MIIFDQFAGTQKCFFVCFFWTNFLVFLFLTLYLPIYDLQTVLTRDAQHWIFLISDMKTYFSQYQYTEITESGFFA